MWLCMWMVLQENLDLYLVNSFVGDEGRQYITINATRWIGLSLWVDGLGG